MYAFEPQIRIQLQFDAMEEPVEISVPWNVLRYLDTHADRYLASDGTVVYVHPRSERRRDFRMRFGPQPALAVA